MKYAQAILVSYYFCITTGYQRVFLSLRGVTILNNSYVDIADIGGKNSNKEGLLCHSDRFEHGRILQLQSADWYFPNGSQVWNYKDFQVAYRSTPYNTFQKNTGYGLIRLITHGSPSERGRFYCVIPDARNNTQTLYVNMGMCAIIVQRILIMLAIIILYYI